MPFTVAVINSPVMSSTVQLLPGRQAPRGTPQSVTVGYIYERTRVRLYDTFVSFLPICNVSLCLECNYIYI
jgi:hypothetical protein